MTKWITETVYPKLKQLQAIEYSSEFRLQCLGLITVLEELLFIKEESRLTVLEKSLIRELYCELSHLHCYGERQIKVSDATRHTLQFLMNNILTLEQSGEERLYLLLQNMVLTELVPTRQSHQIEKTIELLFAQSTGLIDLINHLCDSIVSNQSSRFQVIEKSIAQMILTMVIEKLVVLSSTHPFETSLIAFLIDQFTDLMKRTPGLNGSIYINSLLEICNHQSHFGVHFPDTIADFLEDILTNKKDRTNALFAAVISVVLMKNGVLDQEFILRLTSLFESHHGYIKKILSVALIGISQFIPLSIKIMHKLEGMCVGIEDVLSTIHKGPEHSIYLTNEKLNKDREIQLFDVIGKHFEISLSLIISKNSGSFFCIIIKGIISGVNKGNEVLGLKTAPFTLHSHSDGPGPLFLLSEADIEYCEPGRINEVLRAFKRWWQYREISDQSIFQPILYRLHKEFHPWTRDFPESRIIPMNGVVMWKKDSKSGKLVSFKIHDYKSEKEGRSIMNWLNRNYYISGIVHYPNYGILEFESKPDWELASLIGTL